jgi:putative nucleotidyltransferase with HDIG domain
MEHSLISAVNSLKGLVVIIDNSGSIKYVNKEFETELQVSSEKLLQKHIADVLYHGHKLDEKGAYLSPLLETLETGVEYYQKEVLIRTAYNIVPAYFTVTTNRIISARGELEGVVGIYFRVRRRKNLRGFESRERTLISEQIETIYAFAEAIGARDLYTMGHSEKVAEYAMLIAEKMGLSSEEVDLAYFCGIVHDVGKIGVPERILNKPGRLTKEERLEVEGHTERGVKILSQISWLERVVPIIRSHHERFDGKGYPLGLAGGDIPVIGRILAVADSFDAMMSDRCYRKALPLETALNELKKNAGTQFDPVVVKAFIATLQGYMVIPGEGEVIRQAVK